jgi:hypothetical protein
MCGGVECGMLLGFDCKFSTTHEAKEGKLNGGIHVGCGERAGWLGDGNETMKDVERDGGGWFAGTVTKVPLDTLDEPLSDWGFKSLK